MYVTGYRVRGILADGFMTVRSQTHRSTQPSAASRQWSFVALSDHHCPWFRFASLLTINKCIVSACIILKKELAKDTFSGDPFNHRKRITSNTGNSKLLP
jgi:hypothetical protein